MYGYGPASSDVPVTRTLTDGLVPTATRERVTCASLCRHAYKRLTFKLKCDKGDANNNLSSRREAHAAQVGDVLRSPRSSAGSFASSIGREEEAARLAHVGVEDTALVTDTERGRGETRAAAG